jgi:hypothetical protein
MASLGFFLDCRDIDTYGDAEFAVFNSARIANVDDELTREAYDKLRYAEFWAGLTPEEAFDILYPDLAAEGCGPVVATEDRCDDFADPEFARELNLRAAITLAEKGYSVFPVRRDKTPYPGFRWREASTSDAAKIRAWWRQFPDAMPAIDCGKSRIVVIDADRHHADKDGVAALFDLLGDDPLQWCDPVVETAGGGLHVLFAQPLDGAPFGNQAGALPDGIDVRGAGGYIVAAGACLADGRSWRPKNGTPSPFFVGPGELGQLPKVLAELIRAPKARAEQPRAEAPRSEAWQPDGEQLYVGKREIAAAKGLLKSLADKLGAMGRGQHRNAALNSAALAMGHEVGAGRISRAEVSDALYDACRRNGWLAQDGQRAFDATFLSGFEAGLLEPAGPLKDRQRDGGQSLGATEKLIDGLRRKADEARLKAEPPHDPETGEIFPNAADDAGARHDGVDDSEDAVGLERLSAAWWRRLQLPPRDYLLGDVICSTSRWHLAGETGTGKTLFSLDMAAAIATGSDFLGWEGRRPSRVMYLDGEMPAETFQERMNVVIDRYGEGMSLFGYNRDVLGQDDMPPLNTDKGMVWLWNEIQKIKPDAIFFDSVMCLLEGNMSEEDSWNPIKPYIRFLTSQRIAQVWIDHTGHDATRAYGTKTKQWEMDTVAMLSKLKGEEFDDSAAAMQFEFAKKRLCTPSNYKQFQPKIITGGENGLVHKDGQGSSKKVSQLDVIKRQFVVVYDRLAFDVEYSAGHAGENVKKVAVADVRERLKSTGYLDTNDKGQITSSDRQTFKKAKTSLLINGGFTEKDGMVWRFKDA